MNTEICYIHVFSQHGGNFSFYLFSHQWNVCKEICEILDVFSYATKQLYGVYYSTFHLDLVNYCCNIALILNEYITNDIWVF